MTEKSQPDLNEVLSALKDGETTDWELRKVLQQTTQEPELVKRWQAYQVISSALRYEVTAGVDISAAVSARLSTEKAGVAGWLITARKPLAQTAIAASVAAIAVLGVQQYHLASVQSTESAATLASSANDNSAPVRLPEGFTLPNLTTQNVSSTSLGGARSAPVEVLSVQIPVFDREALKTHFETSLLDHSANAAEATQLVIPRARAPQPVE